MKQEAWQFYSFGFLHCEFSLLHRSMVLPDVQESPHPWGSPGLAGGTGRALAGGTGRTPIRSALTTTNNRKLPERSRSEVADHLPRRRSRERFSAKRGHRGAVGKRTGVCGNRCFQKQHRHIWRLYSYLNRPPPHMCTFLGCSSLFHFRRPFRRGGFEPPSATPV